MTAFQVSSDLYQSGLCNLDVRCDPDVRLPVLVRSILAVIHAGLAFVLDVYRLL